MKPRQRNRLSRASIVVGGVLMLLGGGDPLEGSIIILPACGLVTLGIFTSQDLRVQRFYWLWLLAAMSFGVAAMFVLSAFGGLGGKHGHSLWWGLLILPYPIAWLLALARLIVTLVSGMRHKQLKAH